MQQYYDLKQSYEDSILFFRMGDFYEMFENDAQIAHNVLWIALTSRNKNAQNPIPLAGIPYHAKEKYLGSLVKAGYKVAIAEQVSDPKLKGIVQREVTRVVTPATLRLESDSYDTGTQNSVIISITYDTHTYGLAILDIETSSFTCCEFLCFSKLCEQIYKINPWEVILEKHLFGDSDLVSLLQKKYSLNIFYFQGQNNPHKRLTQFFWVTSLESFGIEWKIECQRSAAQLLEYLQEHQKTHLSFIDGLSYESFSGYMWLDESTIRSLDLVYNLSTQSETVGTLFWVLNETKTSMGKKYLREQILQPLQDPWEIQKRQKYIAAFLSDKKLLDEVVEKLKYVSNLDAILNRISLNRAGIKDMIQLKKSLQSIVAVQDIIQKSDNSVLKKLFT